MLGYFKHRDAEVPLIFNFYTDFWRKICKKGSVFVKKAESERESLGPTAVLQLLYVCGVGFGNHHILPPL